MLGRRRPRWPSPLDERVQSGLTFLARTPLGDPSRRLGPIWAVEDEALCVPGSARRSGTQLGEQSGERCFEVGGDFVHEPDPERRRGVKPLARDEVRQNRCNARSQRGDRRLPARSSTK